MTKEVLESYLSNYYKLEDYPKESFLRHDTLLLNIDETQQYAIDTHLKHFVPSKGKIGKIFIYEYCPNFIKNLIFYVDLDSETTTFIEKNSNTPTNNLLAKRLIDAFKPNSVKFITDSQENCF